MDLDIARDVTGTRQEAGVMPAGRVELGGDSGTSTNSQTWILVPTASRSPARAMPIGAWNARKWVLRWSPSSRTSTSLPAWYVVTSSDAPSCRKSEGKFVVWTARNGAASSILGWAVSSVGAAGELGVAIVSTFHSKRADVRDPESNCDRGTDETVCDLEMATDQGRRPGAWAVWALLKGKTSPAAVLYVRGNPEASGTRELTSIAMGS